MTKFWVGITTCDRPRELEALLFQLRKAWTEGVPLEVAVYDDGISDVSAFRLFCKQTEGLPWSYYRTPPRGKPKFWQTHRDMLATFLKSDCDVYVSLPDDVELSSRFFSVLHETVRAPVEALHFHRDARSKRGCWGARPPTYSRRVVVGARDVHLEKSGWVDGFNAFARSAVERLEPLHAPEGYDWERNPKLGSGVGAMMTKLLRRARVDVYQLDVSLVHHLGVESRMNPLARAKTPLSTLEYLP